MSDRLEIHLRRVKLEDRKKVIEVESKSTPNLSYVPDVWEMFTSDTVGEFSVAEIDGEIVACGKQSVLPDGSAWLETLRVTPERQGLGVGKRFYEHWLKHAEKLGINTLRMYTGLRNVKSKGLAERYGFHLAETFRGASYPCHPDKAGGNFQKVTSSERANELLAPLSDMWHGFHVINRTFYKHSPELYAYLVEKEMIYEDLTTCSVITLGARFKPYDALHIGIFGGNMNACLEYSMKLGVERGSNRLNCDFPSSELSIEHDLKAYGFNISPSEFIVMERYLE